jgi:Na+-driven multidrug efflux pump
MLSRFKNNSRDILSLLKTGGAISFTVALELGMTLAVGIFSGLIDVQAQSAMTYNMQFMYFEFIGLAALSFSTTQEISRLLGAGQPINASRFGRYGLLTTLSYLAPIPILFAVYPNALIGISGGAEEPVKKILSSLVPIMSIGVLIDIVRYNLLQQTRAFNDLIVPNIIAGLGLGSGIALSWALGLQTNLGIDGVGTGYTLGIALTTTPLLIRWVNLLRTTSKPKSVIIEELPEEDNTLSTRVVKALKQLSFLKSNGEKSPLLQPPELQINYH